ncbi:hypothetical protein C488_18075 [Natrinema pellirubrum DSM 15624]|uniref:Uncharacterized protein n=1 Tax=Natrinema pellirubrum (strain DSM 15624 / CIP 106293 / JCM 10476 / NCIMB 786 / 157) TaxID=797303 RepID=L0JQH5_NATP1|nr:hypothetical protein [Natrinema pellirubrum]AGB33489.1 hypothetical protein Natpe_3727 [Natrinema pellirubrum DSM 15624]ELY70720.1 hypothetical protein C488_18075 [Natrinema pellirubrum DSM 15624]
MARDELENAADAIEAAAAAAADDEAQERLEKQAAKFAEYADADRGPDHGQLARHEHILNDIADEEGGDVASKLADALESISAFRETVEGV